jgi:hypothetical protein
MRFTEQDLCDIEKSIDEERYCDEDVARVLINEIRRLRDTLADLGDSWQCSSKRNTQGVLIPPYCRELAEKAIKGMI